MVQALDREAVVEQDNPLGLAGIEFVEYTTPRPQALGQVLEQLGFRPVSRHRSREVTRYRQGDLNVIVNAHDLPPGTSDAPQIAAVALRVRDAGAAWRRTVDLGAWPVPVKVQPMELHIPGIHGVGASRVYFVDRWADFSIYDVDFVPIPTVDPVVPALAGLHWFGIVQYIGAQRTVDWTAFYGELFGFRPVPEHTRFGILPAGRVLASPCGSFWLQLIEPGPQAEAAGEAGCGGADDGRASEQWQRLAFGTPDVPGAVRALRARGIDFIDSASLHPDAQGALTRPLFGGALFELVHHVRR